MAPSMASLQNVLVVEPNHDFRVMLRAGLEEGGYFVFTSGTGIDGLALLQRVRDVTVILLAPELPIMSAEQFLAIKRQDKELAKIPVLVMGSHNGKLISLGVKGFIRKPIDSDNLLGEIEKVLKEHES